jgi:hypothetical protein
MRSSACLRFGGSGESEEGNSEFMIQNSKLPVTFARLRSFCAILRISNFTARFDGVGAAAKRGQL